MTGVTCKTGGNYVLSVSKTTATIASHLKGRYGVSSNSITVTCSKKIYSGSLRGDGCSIMISYPDIKEGIGVLQIRKEETDPTADPTEDLETFTLDNGLYEEPSSILIALRALKSLRFSFLLGSIVGGRKKPTIHHT